MDKDKKRKAVLLFSTPGFDWDQLRKLEEKDPELYDEIIEMLEALGKKPDDPIVH